ncbi:MULTISPECIES: hypothetical protein [unclassified Pseudomonas]|uniref:hypothetical protein n=1 Tax=unclassified Pseudomonas TaxID=196821 RepID=UPI0011AF1DC1|nr:MULTISPECIES: hypothetical protein [unclassified Pseudomonas]QDQ70683.1 hypothetical protein pJBCL41_00442 [Pseudomonas sp.]
MKMNENSQVSGRMELSEEEIDLIIKHRQRRISPRLKMAQLGLPLAALSVASLMSVVYWQALKVSQNGNVMDAPAPLSWVLNLIN